MIPDRHRSVAMKQVHSSHVNAVGYNPSTEELHIEYKNGGGRHVYKDVPRDKAHLVMNGMSIGKALHAHVRGQHDHEVF